MLANAFCQLIKRCLNHRNREQAHSCNSRMHPASLKQSTAIRWERGLSRDLARSGSTRPLASRDRSVLLAAHLNVSQLVLLIPRIRQHYGIGDRGKGHVQCDGGRRPVWPGNRRGV